MATGQPQELESLVGRVTLDVTDFKDGADGVARKLDELLQRFTSFGQAVTPIFTGIGAAITAPLQSAVTTVGASLTAIEGQITGFINRIGGLNTGSMAVLGRSLGRISDFINSVNVNRISPQRFERTGTGVSGFVQQFVDDTRAISALDLGNFRMSGYTLGRMGEFIEQVRKFDSASLHFMPAISTGIGQFVTDLGNIDPSRAMPAIGAITKLKTALGGLAKLDVGAAVGNPVQAVSGFFNLMSTVQIPNNLDGIATAMARFKTVLTGLSQITSTQITAVGSAGTAIANLMNTMASASAGPDLSQTIRSIGQIASLRTALLRLSVIDPARLTAVGASMRNLLTQLSTVPVSPNLNATVAALSKLGSAMRGLMGTGGVVPPAINIAGAAGAGGGGGPAAPLFNIARGFNRIPPAATRAATSLGDFGQAAKAMFLTSDTAMKGLQRIQTSLLGIVVLGVAQFARLDDAMARTLAHMREFDPNSSVRSQLQTGVLALSSGTRTGASDIARGLDKLTASGMNATMALENLATAENFAVASGMPMQKATQRLVDLMNATGLAAENTEDHYNNMRRLSDMIVGIASRVGSSEEQLSEAFTGRFINSMKTANLDVADAMALLATYSRFGETTRGAAAGTRLSRGLENLNIQATSHGPLWTALLGQDIMGGNGRFAVKGIELIERLGKALDGMDQQRRTAQLLKLGFNTEGIAALEPLLRQWPTIRLIRDELDKTGSISEKTAALIRSSMLGQLTTLFNAASNVATIFGERLAPVFHVVTTAISDMAIAFARLAPWYQNLIIGAAALFVVMRNLNVVFGLFAFVLSPLTAAVKGVVAVGSLLYTVFSFAFDAALAGVYATISGFKTLGQGIYYSVVAMTKFGWTVAGIINDISTGARTILGFLKKIAEGLVGAIMTFAVNALAFLLGLVTSLVSAVLGLIAALAFLPVILGTIGTLATVAFAAVGAFAVTAILTLGSLASLIGSGLVAAWGAFQVAATAAMGWIGAAVTHVHDNVGALWESVKGGAAGFLKSAAAALEKIAGFFWNFQHNMKIIWGWFAEHGEQAFLDLANAAFKFIEILAGNLKLLFGAIGSTVYQTLTAAWGSIQNYLGAFFGWFGSQWKNIVSDMGTILNALFGSFKSNFVQLFDILGAMVGTITEQIHLGILNASGIRTNAQVIRATEEQLVPQIRAMSLRIDDKKALRDPLLRDVLEGTMPGAAKYRELDKEITELLRDRHKTMKQLEYTRTYAVFPDVGWTTEQENKYIRNADLQYFAEKRAEAMKGWQTFKPSGVDLAKLPYKTDLTAMFGTAGSDSIKLWEGLGGNVSDAFGKAFGGMTPFANAFKHIADSEAWQDLWGNLNFGLPEGGLKSVLAKFTPAFFGAPATDGEFGLAPPNKGGPGFKFTQTSLERTMIGGPVAENLEYQQLNTLKSIDRKQDNIVNAINNLGGAQPNRRPPPMMRDE